MDFELNKEAKMIQDAARKFSKNVLEPNASEADEKEIFPRNEWVKLSELGFAGLLVPEEFGGSESDYKTMVAVMEEFGKGCIAIAGTYSVHLTIQSMLINYGSEEQKKKYLPQMVSGEKIGAMGLTESDAGSDLSPIKSEAVLIGNNYKINGTKVFITTAGEADIYIVFARVNEASKKENLTAFIVEKGTNGFEFGKIEDKMGYRGSPTGELVFRDCVVPKNNMIGEVGDGFKMVLNGLNYGRISVGALALGIGVAAYERCLKHVKERKQFGRSISSFQGIQWMLADMATSISASRLLLYQAASMADKGERFIKEASMAKCYATDTAMRVTTDAVQLLGGYGYLKDYIVERHMREAKIFQIVEGTNQIQRTTIGKELLRTNARIYP